MFLVRDPASYPHYGEFITHSEAYTAADYVASCNECGDFLAIADPRVTFEYASANPGSDDRYVTVMCLQCAPLAAQRIQTSLREAEALLPEWAKN